MDEITEDAVAFMVARDVLIWWKAVEVKLDPSYTVNILVLQGPDIDRALLKKACLESGYSWKALGPSIKWMDYDDEQEDSAD